MLQIPQHLLGKYPDILTKKAITVLESLAMLNQEQQELMAKRNQRRKTRIESGSQIGFLPENEKIGGTDFTAQDARAGRFTGCAIPHDLQKQWIQGTGPATRPGAPTEKSLRNVAYALLSGADGWMFDGEDALGQIGTMSLDNQRNLKLAIERHPLFLSIAKQVAEEMNAWGKEFFGRDIIGHWDKQLEFTTVIFRARGLHLADRHITTEEQAAFSASITDAVLYVVNNYRALQAAGRSIVLYLPKIQTAEEAAFWNKILTRLEQHLGLESGTVKTYVLIEQLEATFQLMEIRAALGLRFVGFNTGRWDYINSVADAMCGVDGFINPNIEAITMTYAYMANYEDRVRRCVNTPDQQGNFALWQGGMEPNIPVGSPEGVKASMEKALAGARREQQAGASGKWVAHWKMVHIIRPVWEEKGQDNQLGRSFPPLTYSSDDAAKLTELADAPRSIRGARNLLSVALQYGNAFLQGYQAAALKPADFFSDNNILYLMEDMATGEIRVSVLWEWLHKGGKLNEADPEMGIEQGSVFSQRVFDQLLEEEYDKLLNAKDKDVHNDSKTTTLPIAKAIVKACVNAQTKAPWYVDLLNLNLNNQDLEVAENRIKQYFEQLETQNKRLIDNLDLV